MAADKVDLLLLMGEHTSAIRNLETSVQTLESTQRETNRHLKDIAVYVPQTVKRKDCEDNRKECAAQIKKEISKRSPVPWDKRAVIAAIGLFITFLSVFGGAVWFISSELSEIRNAQINYSDELMADGYDCETEDGS